LICTGTKFTVNYEIFINNPDESLELITALGILAKRDNYLHIVEKIYVKHVGHLLGYAENDVEDLLKE
jgi:hypothetical protein